MFSFIPGCVFVTLVTAVVLAIPGRSPCAPSAPQESFARDDKDLNFNQDKEALAKYQAIFGKEEAAVMATPATRDDAQFAARLMAKTKDLADDPKLATVLCQKAYAFGCKDPEGYPAAASALRYLQELKPTRRANIRPTLIDLLRAELKRSSSIDRAAVTQSLVDELITAGDAALDARDETEAPKILKEALGLAQGIRSPRSDTISAKLKDIQKQAALKEKVVRLEKQLQAAPGNSAIARRVLYVYLLEMDDPRSALTFAAGNFDSKVKEMVALATEDPKRLTSDQCLALAGWYRSLAPAADGVDKAAALGRALDYLKRYLREHDKHDAERLGAETELEAVSKELIAAAVATTATEIVIWNTHDGPSDNSGATKINLILFLHDKAVWRRDDVPIDWAADKDMSVTVPIAAVSFDRVRVEITAWHGVSGGLSEIQVLKGRENISQGAMAIVSASYDDRFPASTLTDGITTSAIQDKGYWVLPANQPGWADVLLTGRP